MNDSAFRELRAAAAAGERILFTHYACGNFHRYPDQPTPIACIALAEAGTLGQDKVFSVIDTPTSVELMEREKALLARFYEELQSHPDARVVHWNMSSPAFGFGAIAARYVYLHGRPAPDFPLPDRRFDLDDIILGKFGKGFAAHPKLRHLCVLNGLFMPHFMPGEAEAAAVERQEYGPVRNSTIEKVRLIANLFRLLCAGKLKTLNSVGWVNFAGEQIDAVSAVMRIAERLRMVNAELARRHDRRPTLTLNDEYDAQDLFRGLLRIFFDNVKAEDPTSQMAGASSRIDFVLPDVGLAIELKYARATMSTKELGEQLIVDKTRYSSHGKVSHLLFLIFDRDYLVINPAGVASDLSREKSEDDFAVTIRILQG